MAQRTTQPLNIPKERVAKALKECGEQSSDFRIFPKEIGREAYALLIFACSVHCPIERVAEDKFRVNSMTEKGKTFSIKEGDDFRRVFKLMVKAFLPSPDQRMLYLRKAEQYAEACLSAVDEMHENNGSLPLLSDILPTLSTESEAGQDGPHETAGPEKDAPKDQPVTPASTGAQASPSTPGPDKAVTSASDQMTAEQKIEAIQRMLGISAKSREEQEQREQTIIKLQKQVEKLQTEKEQAEERTAQLRQEYDDYKLKIRNFVLD